MQEREDENNTNQNHRECIDYESWHDDRDDEPVVELEDEEVHLPVELGVETENVDQGSGANNAERLGGTGFDVLRLQMVEVCLASDNLWQKDENKTERIRTSNEKSLSSRARSTLFDVFLLLHVIRKVQKVRNEVWEDQNDSRPDEDGVVDELWRINEDIEVVTCVKLLI